MSITLKEVLAKFEGEAVPDWRELETQLTEREDNMADLIRLAGMQFGMYPEIVAAVLCDVGLGTPVTDEQRALIRSQFVALMERLTAEQGGAQ